MQPEGPAGLPAAAHLLADPHAKLGGVPRGDQQGATAGEQAPCVRPGPRARPDRAKGEARPLELLVEVGQIAAHRLVSHRVNPRSASAHSISWRRPAVVVERTTIGGEQLGRLAYSRPAMTPSQACQGGKSRAIAARAGGRSRAYS